ncbi:MAG: hypothetical protein HQL21_04905 [Candidatus Omnitrophica bacterium]|nr:hypothetical protein [Candidatus Omnitrophota bacterium]
MCRKIILIVGAMTLAMTTVLWAEEGIITKTLPEGVPQVTTVSPQDTVASMGWCRYPRFEYSPENDHPVCEKLLRTHISLTPRPPNTACPTAFAHVDGLVQSITVPPEYRRTASLMVTWTIRVEGLSDVVTIMPGEIYDPKKEAYICSWWNGTSIQSFPGGKVQTRLLVNGTQMPTDFTASLTLPDGGGARSIQDTNCGNGALDPGEQCDLTSVANQLCPDYPDGSPGPKCNTMTCMCKSLTTTIVDPTITGSVVLTPADFGGEFPGDPLNLRVQWNNDTCMTVRSKEKFRSMIVTLLPQGNQ